MVQLGQLVQTSHYSRGDSTIPNKATKRHKTTLQKQQSRKSGTGRPKLFSRTSYSKHMFWSYLYTRSHEQRNPRSKLSGWVLTISDTGIRQKKVLFRESLNRQISSHLLSAPGCTLCSNEVACQQMATNKN